jgi:hypothetical protein
MEEIKSLKIIFIPKLTKAYKDLNPPMLPTVLRFYLWAQILVLYRNLDGVDISPDD